MIFREDACYGRRPEGLHSATLPEQSALAHHWSTAAHLEASAAVAFRTLARELADFGAPGVLVKAALRAAIDEDEHAALTGTLAERHGGVRVAPEVTEPAHRDLEAFATENAVEGCVREAFGALVAAFQARHADDPEVARIMSRIARDETRHAHLSWQIARWAEDLLDEETLRRVRVAERRTIEALLVATRRPHLAAIARGLELPAPSEAAALLESLRGDLWNHASAAAL